MGGKMFLLSLVIFYAIFIGAANSVIQCGWGGKAPLTTRIIKGRYAYPHEFPFAVYLTLSGISYCGGTIISDRYVVTAGHCVYGHEISRMKIVAGDSSRYYDVAKAIINDHYYRHSDYDDQDIALLKTYETIAFRTAVSPICLPSRTDYTAKTMVVPSWGRTKSRFLSKSYVKLMDSDICLESTHVNDMKKIENICAYGHEGNVCKGDSGGGLIYEVEPYRYELVGIVSWGIGCASKGFPSVYVNVSHYIPWIRRKTADSVLLPYY